MTEFYFTFSQHLSRYFDIRVEMLRHLELAYRRSSGVISLQTQSPRVELIHIPLCESVVAARICAEETQNRVGTSLPTKKPNYWDAGWHILG